MFFRGNWERDGESMRQRYKIALPLLLITCFLAVPTSPFVLGTLQDIMRNSSYSEK